MTLLPPSDDMHSLRLTGLIRTARTLTPTVMATLATVFSEGSTAKQQLDELQAVLGFDYGDQDWGIVNADGRRVLEFAGFFESHYNDHWSQWTVGEFVDLVFESASDAIRADADFPVDRLDGFVAIAAPRAADRIAYWTEKDWAITPYLRSLGLS